MRILTLLLASWPAWAGLVTISETLKDPDGATYSGRIIVTLSSPARAQPLRNSDGQSLTGFQRTLTVTAGVVSVELEANDTITPSGTSYAARFIPGSGAREWTETWVVPTSGSALKVHEVRATTIPTPTVMVTPAQITGGSATSGQALVWNGSAWAPATVGGGTVYTASASIDVAPVYDGTCVLDSTAVTVTGAALGGRPSIGSSFQPPEGVTLVAKVTGPNSMRIEICNWSGSTYDPSSATYYFGIAQ
jgi:hypothetical protein